MRASGRRVANIEWQITAVAPQLYRPDGRCVSRAKDSGLIWQIAEAAYISMSGLRRPRRRHFICGWLCLTQNRPFPIGTRKTEVGLLLQHC